MTNLEQQCIAEIEATFVRAEKCFNREFPRPEVVFCNRLRTTAGIAYYSETGGKIKLSRKLLNANGLEFVKRTPAHEVAHLVTDRIYGTETRPHGKEWKSVMTALGQEASIYHSFTAKGEHFLYRNEEGQEQYITKIRHNKLQCGKVLNYRFKGKEPFYKEHFISG